MPIADKFPRLRRISTLILVLAAIAVYFGVVSPNAAEDHAVTIELQGSTAGITKLETVWTGIDFQPGEPIGGATFNYQAGKAPSKVSTRVHAPSGAYWLDVSIYQGELVTIRRRITLDGADVTVFVPLSP